MRRLATVPVVLVALALAAAPALAHFQEIIPSDDVLSDGGTVTLDLVFTHPMERGPVMEMAKPRRVGMLRAGRTTDLTAALVETRVDGRTGWRLAADLAEPGAAVFFVEPQPYWEAAEKTWIVHYAKVVVDGYASGEGWAAAVGLPVEIEPLARPTGLWTGNLFRGLVRRDGVPVPFAEVEVEWRNDGSVVPPNEAFVTQVIRADAGGVFAYAMPRAGWWGFAALVEGPAATAPDGGPARTELGGLVWVRATDMAATRPPAK
jgi:cobalt/nickel transport protein